MKTLSGKKLSIEKWVGQSCPVLQSSRDSLSEFLLLLQATHYTINYPIQHRATLITILGTQTQQSILLLFLPMQLLIYYG